MLSSIHPLGERSRQNSWALTVASFTVGSALAGATVGAASGWAGSFVFGGLSSDAALLVLGLALAASSVLDGLRIDPPGPERQVNESWIGTFRGWIYGGAFGVQLGAGVVTYVVTWSVYATLLGYALLASPGRAALVGLTFGLGRSLSVLAAVFVDRPSRLTTFNRAVASIGPAVRRGSVVLLSGFALISVATGVL